MRILKLSQRQSWGLCSVTRGASTPDWPRDHDAVSKRRTPFTQWQNHIQDESLNELPFESSAVNMSLFLRIHYSQTLQNETCRPAEQHAGSLTKGENNFASKPSYSTITSILKKFNVTFRYCGACWLHGVWRFSSKKIETFQWQGSNKGKLPGSITCCISSQKEHIISKTSLSRFTAISRNEELLVKKVRWGSGIVG